MLRIKKGKKLQLKSAFLIDLHRNGPVVRWTCIRKGCGEKVCVEKPCSHLSLLGVLNKQQINYEVVRRTEELKMDNFFAGVDLFCFMLIFYLYKSTIYLMILHLICLVVVPSNFLIGDGHCKIVTCLA